jgi:hypothetical protein
MCQRTVGTDDHWGDEDPEPPDDEDPVVQDELLQIWQSFGWKLDDLVDRAIAAKYGEWLRLQ